jgi:hypothetical protein
MVLILSQQSDVSTDYTIDWFYAPLAQSMRRRPMCGRVLVRQLGKAFHLN